MTSLLYYFLISENVVRGPAEGKTIPVPRETAEAAVIGSNAIRLPGMGGPGPAVSPITQQVKRQGLTPKHIVQSGPVSRVLSSTGQRLALSLSMGDHSSGTAVADGL